MKRSLLLLIPATALVMSSFTQQPPKKQPASPQDTTQHHTRHPGDTLRTKDKMTPPMRDHRVDTVGTRKSDPTHPVKPRAKTDTTTTAPRR